MTNRKPFYGGANLHVRSYDSMLEPPPAAIQGDTEFYRRVCEAAGGRILEIGVGTGRISLRLAAAGLSVVGMDASDAMLEIAREKATASPNTPQVELVRGDMRDFDLGTRFSAIIVPFRAFQHLLTPEDQRRALASFHRHLDGSGVLVLHLFDPDLGLLVHNQVRVEKRIGVDRATGRKAEAVVESGTPDYAMQVRREMWRYRALNDEGETVEEEDLELVLRWTYRWEMHHLLELSGFTVEAEFSDFKRSPPAYGREQIWVARRV